MSVISFILVIFICILYILFMRNLFGQFSSLRNTSEYIMLWVSFFRLLVWSHSSCKCPYSFCFVVFQYFLRCKLFYAILRVQQCVMSSLLNFR